MYAMKWKQILRAFYYNMHKNNNQRQTLSNTVNTYCTKFYNLKLENKMIYQVVKIKAWSDRKENYFLSVKQGKNNKLKKYRKLLLYMYLTPDTLYMSSIVECHI